MAFKRSGVRFSYAPQNPLIISDLRHLRINLRIKQAKFMRNFFYYPPLYFDCFWAGPTSELSGNPPRHTSGNTQKNPAPQTVRKVPARLKYSVPLYKARSGFSILIEECLTFRTVSPERKTGRKFHHRPEGLIRIYTRDGLGARSPLHFGQRTETSRRCWS